MQTELLTLLLICLETISQEIVMVAKTHSTLLIKYMDYSDAAVLQFKIPEDVHFVSFKFEAEEIEESLFRCEPNDIDVYLKSGSPPVINPDNSELPKHFLNYSGPIEELKFTSNKTCHYINVTSPYAGFYFAAAFIAYTDPRLRAITQQGLTAKCLTVLNAELWVIKKPRPYIIVPEKQEHVILHPRTNRIFKFYVSDYTEYVILHMKKIKFCVDCTKIKLRVQSHRIPNVNESLYSMDLTKEAYDTKNFKTQIMTVEDSWYYVSFNLDSKTDSEAEFAFTFKCFSTYPSNDTQLLFSNETKIFPLNINSTRYYKHSILRNYASPYLHLNLSYNQYNLVREGSIENFFYSFDLHPDTDGSVPSSVNITNNDMTALKFHINPATDIGGTLQFSLAFKPRIRKKGAAREIGEESKQVTIIGCLRNNGKEIPTWPNKCVLDEKETIAPIILNRTLKNSTVYVPFPDAGNWYATFKLFCGKCEPCECTEKCRQELNSCPQKCEMECDSVNLCNSCIETCENDIRDHKACSNCNCDGPCLKASDSCNASVLFAAVSFPCISGKCGSNGKCVYLISEGVAYSVCICTNHYKGWDCSDSSGANSKGVILMELLLLVLSNVVFLPATYIAYRRGYYVEAVVYFSTGFFSSFYHACDAGENIYSFCIVNLSVLQFSDFFCGLLAIWVTIIAIAHLPHPWPSICHITGAILLSFTTTINKTAIWAFAIPFVTGIIILVASWCCHYKRSKARFPSKRYQCIIFPIGIITVAFGLLTYAFLQTNSNYMYLHSMWHIVIALSIIILIPNKRSFLPASVESSE
ncbi:hypothetical protein PPYR_07673 [Photinus pyralis]|uniref:EGF-like domain-containing protein n=2 Tax=Photinus pyralis TaxID=7054 RepID=A0A5N4AR96_PHOPY|nr:post-GPI attachment to proteins factor 6 [Photinus pyralis]KAB0799793.1 hypothetical protein PPYR_07673 [Photinus pyralis]